MVKNIKGSDGNTFSSTNQPANAGRKKKIYTVLKELGYGADDIRTAFGELAFYTENELNEVIQDADKPMITKIIAKAFIEAYKKGDYYKVKEIIEQIIGKPQQKLDHTTKGQKIENQKHTVVFKDYNKADD